MLSKKIGIAAIALAVAACGGGGGGGTNTSSLPSLPANVVLSKSDNVNYGDLPGDQYNFSTTPRHAYSVSVTSTMGDADLMLLSEPYIDDETTPSFWSSDYDAPEPDIINFISDVDTVYPYVYTSDTGSADYQITITSNHLKVDGDAHTGYIYDYNDVYYSFDATSGTAYRVTLTPIECEKRSGECNDGDHDPSLSVYSSSEDGGDYLSPANRVDYSSVEGVEEIAFIAETNGIYYAEVDDGDMASYTIEVDEIGENPDLVVKIDEVAAYQYTMMLTYTVRNRGLTAANAFNVHFLADSEATPSASAIGTSELISGLDAGESYSATIELPNSLKSGTAYGIVDPEGAITEDDESNNVSKGMPWTIAVDAPVTFDFEDGQIPEEFALGGDALWKIDSSINPEGSSYSFKAGTVGEHERSCFQVSAGGAALMTFDWKVESDDSNNDELRFYVDGRQRSSFSGVRDWTTYSYLLTDYNVHNYKWCFNNDKDGITYGRNTAWVDNIKFEKRPNLTVSIDSASYDGTYLTVAYTVNNTGNADAPSSQIQVWPDMASAPSAGSVDGITQVIQPIVAGGSYSGSISTVQSTNMGIAYAAIDSPTNAIVELKENDNVSAGMPWTGTAIANYSFEDGLTTGFVMSGDADWFVTTVRATDGSYSIQSGTPPYGLLSCTAVTVDNSSGITFDWMLNEVWNDYLYFYIDDSQVARLNSDRSWTQAYYRASSTGTHTYKWCFQTLASSSSDVGEGGVDNINVY